MVDETKLNEFIGKILGDLGGAFSVPMVRMGDKLGLYKALKEQGSLTPAELAAKTNVAERYARGMALASGDFRLLDYDPATGKFTLPPEQAMVFAKDVDSPVYLQVGFRSRGGDGGKPAEGRGRVSLRRGRRLGRPGAVLVLVTVGRFFPPRLSQQSCSVLAARPGRRRPRNSKAARKWLTLVAVTGFRPSSWRKRSLNRRSLATTFIPNRVEQARVHAEQHGAAGNTKFEVAMASDFPWKGPGSRHLLRLPA